MADEEICGRVAALATALQARRQRLVTAESCTGGWLAKVCTDRAGSSAWFDCGFVTYSNAAKSQALAVPATLIAAHGAVSAEVAAAMAAGALTRSAAHWSVAITGVAGPEGGSAEKPVGTVWLAFGSVDNQPRTQGLRFSGGRDAVRRAAVAAAVDGLLEALRLGG